MRRAVLVFVSILALAHVTRAAPPAARVDTDKDGKITFLSWDTEGGGRAERNLLRAPAAASGGKSLQASAERGRVVISNQGAGEVEIVFPFDPRVTPTTVIPARWDDDGTLHLPAIVNAPDFGPMLLKELAGRAVTGRLEGARAEKVANLILHASGPVRLELSPLLLSAPAGLKDDALWPMARRGWLNAIQPCSKWGEQTNPFSSPAGMLGNNVISDPASCSLWFYADQAFLMPEPAPGINLMPLVRRTIEYWIDHL